jgi:hypothetical protein
MVGTIALHRALAPRVTLALFLAIVASGCGDDNDEGAPGEAVSCEWFAGDNCWRKAANEFAACASDSQGAFDASATTCTTTDGGQVSFPAPVPVDVDVDYSWDFTVENSGMACGHFQSLSNDNGYLLTTPSGEVRAEATAAGEVITCPDGAQYSIPIASAFECLFDLPGISWGALETSLFVSLMGGDDTSIFDCTR